MKSVLGFIRVCGVFTTILLGVLSLAVLYPFAGRRIAHRVFMALRWVLLWIVGVKVSGPRFDKIGPGILMANHRSYLDVLFVPTSDRAARAARLLLRHEAADDVALAPRAPALVEDEEGPSGSCFLPNTLKYLNPISSNPYRLENTPA